MKQVAPLRYGVIFKKAFSEPDIFTAFVRDITGIELEIDHVETEKSFPQPIGKVDTRFDLFAEDTKKRIIVDIQHKRLPDHYARFFHYHCAAILQQVSSGDDYQPRVQVITVVVLTSGDKHKKDVATIDCDPKDLQGNALGEIPHKVFYLCPKYANKTTPSPYREWLLAIEDTLDGVVDETDYQNPQILRIFDLIEQDQVTPTERARMFDEHGEHEYLQEKIRNAEVARTAEIAKRLITKGFDYIAIAEVTDLSEAEVIQLLNLSEAEIEELKETDFTELPAGFFDQV